MGLMPVTLIDNPPAAASGNISFDTSSAALTTGMAKVFPQVALGNELLQYRMGVDLRITAVSGTAVSATVLTAGARQIESAEVVMMVAAGLRRRYDVMDFGAIGDGVTDDTPAIQAAITACCASVSGSTGGGVVYFPSGVYLITSGLVITAATPGGFALVSFEGEGIGATRIKKSGATGTILSSTPYASAGAVGTVFWESKISGLSFQYTGTPTSGSIFDFPWFGHVWIEDCMIINAFNVFTWGQTGTVNTANDLHIRGVTCYDIKGALFNPKGIGGGIFINEILAFGDVSKTTSAIWQHNDAFLDPVYMTDCDYENFYDSFRIVAAAASKGLGDSFFQSVIVDAVIGDAWLYVATGSADFITIEHDRIWATSQTGIGFNVNAAGAGSTIKGVNIVQSHFAGGTAGIEVNGNGVTGAAVEDVAFENCQVYSSPLAIYLVACKNFSYRNGKVGQPYNVSSGTINGIYMDGGTNSQFARIEGNLIANYTNPVVENSVHQTSVIRDNMGYNPKGALTAPAVPLTTVGLLNPFPEDCDVYVLGNSAITVTITGATGAASGAIAVANGATVHFRVSHGATITWTGGGAAPTWVWVGD